MNHPVTTNCASIYMSSHRTKNEQHLPLLPMMTFSKSQKKNIIFQLSILGRTSRLIPQSPGSPLRSELRNPRCRVLVGVLWELRFRHRWWNQHPMPWRSFLRCGSKSNLVTSQRESFKRYCWWFRNPAITTWDGAKTSVNNGINYQPQPVQDFFHQQ